MAERILPIIVIYRSPSDYPEKFVVRRQWAGPGTVEVEPDPLAVVDTLREARAAVPRECDSRLAPRPEDDPVIYEVWL